MSRTTALGESWSSDSHGCDLAVDRERRVQQLVQRLGVRDVAEQLHPLVVLDALGLHRGDGLAAGQVLLRRQHLPRVVQRRLEHRHDVQGVGVGLAVEQVEGGEREGRQRLVQREVQRQVLRSGARRGRRRPARPAARSRRRRAAPGRRGWRRAPAPRRSETGLWLSVISVAHGLERVARTGDHVEHHRRRDGELRASAPRAATLSSRSCVGLPHDTNPSGAFLRTTLRRFFGVVAGLGEQPRVLDLVLRRLHHDGARGVEAGATGPSGDLVELAHLQLPLAAARRTSTGRRTRRCGSGR